MAQRFELQLEHPRTGNFQSVCKHKVFYAPADDDAGGWWFYHGEGNDAPSFRLTKDEHNANLELWKQQTRDWVKYLHRKG